MTLAWLSHILHGEGPEECRMIIQKTVDALDPQGIYYYSRIYLK